MSETKRAKRIVLASASPRRAELLRSLGLDFTVLVTDADESVDDSLSPAQTVMTLARRKASSAAERLTDGRVSEDFGIIGVSEDDRTDFSDIIVVGADTIVVDENGGVMGKPKNADDARRMLKLLSGKRHTVHTGVCVIALSDMIERCEVTSTDVYMYELTDFEIDSYIATGEPFDKAGAYGIQSLGGVFVRRIEGDYFNVTGMPKASTARLLRDAGADVIAAPREIAGSEVPSQTILKGNGGLPPL